MTHVISTTQKISRTENIWSQLNSPEEKIGCRHIQVFLLHLGFACAYGMRIIVSIALVAMTKSNSANPNIERLNWSDSIQNIILSSVFLGTTITQIPGGDLARRYGAQKFLSFSIGISGVIATLTPFIALYGGWQAVVAARILTGAFEGVIPSCGHIILSKWVPVEERGRAGSCVYAGSTLGNVIALLSGGAISKSVLGWPSCFYTWGGMAMLWAVMYYFIGKESPSAHPTISLNEKEYIESSLGVTNVVKTPNTPWLAILTSTPFWGLLVAHCADSWGYWMLFTKVPSYMANILDYNIFENGIVTAIPYFIACLLSFPMSFMYDKMLTNGHVSLKAVRKIANTVGKFIPAFALIGFSYVDIEHRNLVVGILIIAVGFNASVYNGYLINHVDLSPNFAGTLMGITNATADIFGIMAPLTCGLIVSDVTNVYQWRQVFFLTAGIYIVGNIVFLVLGDATIQLWNEPRTQIEIDNNITLIPKATIISENNTDDDVN